MKTIIGTLERVRIDAPGEFQNLTIFPLLNGGAREPGYLTLDEALALGRVRITEVSEGGSVPQLKFVNEGERRVLLLDGEELIGAKQNRILNLTILAPASSTIIIPVSCVEAGRWSHRTAEFSTAPRAHYARGRSMKMGQVSAAMVLTGARHSDQGEVWADIDAKAARLNTRSATHAMADIFEEHGARIEDYVRAFAAAENQVGAMFAINGDIIGFDLFDCAPTLRKLLPKLVRSYALDAIEVQTSKSAEAGRDHAEQLLHELTAAEARRFPAIGVGEDVRIDGPRLTAAALVADERVVHLSAFRISGSNGDRATAPQSRVASPTARRAQLTRHSRER